VFANDGDVKKVKKVIRQLPDYNGGSGSGVQEGGDMRAV
jgi:hypothetical protein